MIYINEETPKVKNEEDITIDDSSSWNGDFYDEKKDTFVENVWHLILNIFF